MRTRTTINSEEMKYNNRGRILDHISREPLSRAELSRRTGLTRAGVSRIMDELLEEGLVREYDPVAGSVGRKPVAVGLNGSRYHIISLCLERNCATLALCDFSGQPLVSEQHRRAGGAGDSTEAMGFFAERIQAMIREKKPEGELLGMGIMSPGPLNSRKGQILNPPNFPLWQGVEIADYYRKEFSCPVFLEQNASAYALAENRFGLKGKYENFLELLVDTGLGGGLILGGGLWPEGGGSEFGHMTIDIHGPKCSCGNSGCAELYASIPNIVKAAEKKDGRLDSWREIVHLAEAGDEAGRSAIREEAGYLSSLIVNMVNILDIQAVVLNGEITYKPELLLSALRKKVREQAIEGRGRAEILVTMLPEDKEAVSGANLVLEQYIRRGESGGGVHFS